MSVNDPIIEVPMDRREETVTTQEPGYAVTEHVTRDVAAERRFGVFQVVRIVYVLLGLLQVLLGMRFVLKLIAANAESGFATLIYGITALFVAPFAGLIATPTTGNTIFEVTTLIAMAVYALLVWGIVSVIPIVVDRPSARTTSRATVEQTPGGAGNERTTRTTKIG